MDFVFHHPALEPIREFRVANPNPLGSFLDNLDYGLSKSGLSEGEIGFLNVQHITSNGQIVFTPPTYIDEAPEKKLLEEIDILIARTGHTLGKATLITPEYVGFAFGSFCIRFRLLSHVGVRQEFLVRFLNSSIGQLQILMLKSGAGKYNINTRQIEEIYIPLIKPKYQDTIVAKVQSVEKEASALLEKARCSKEQALRIFLNELKLEIPPITNCENYFFKTGAEKQSLSFFEYPDEIGNRLNYLFYHPRYKALDILCEKYQTVPLAEICREPIVRGEQPEYEEDGDVMVLKTVDLKNGWIDYDNALRVSQEFFEAKPTAHVRRGDILIAATGYVSMGKIDVYDSDEPAMVDGHISIVRVREDYDPYFVTYFLRSHLGQLQFEKWFTGSSGQIELQPPDLGKFIVPDNSEGGVPLEEQERIAEIITEQLQKARELERQAEKKWQDAKEIFEGMIFDRTQ